MSVLDFVDDELAALEARGRRRGVRVVEARRGAEVRIEGRWLVNFSSNDYLGLAAAPALRAAAVAVLDEQGLGAGASRLITGTSDEVVALERSLAAFHRVPAALVFGSGYAANTGVIPALVGRGDLVCSDELNHASIIDGCRLSRAEVRVWRHGDVADLAQALAGGAWRRRLVVTESVFSMGGDRAPLEAIAEVAAAHQAIVMVDDAHAVGVSGEGGRGFGVDAGADVVVGTMGKAFGSTGAYVLGKLNCIQYLWNRARSLVFSTALPAAAIAASRAALSIIESADGAAGRETLAAHARRVRRALAAQDPRIDRALETPIIPVIVGDDRRAVACSEALLERGLLVQAIRPPTVPDGTARLRIALSAAHSAAQLAALIDGLAHLYGSGLAPRGELSGTPDVPSG